MARPAFLHQRDQQRARLLQRAQTLRLAGCRIGVAVHGGVGRDHQHVAGSRGGARRRCTRFDHAQHRNGHRGLDGVQRQRAGGVAGDHEKLGALLAHQELRALHRVARDGAPRFRSIGQARRVADEGKARLRKTPDQGAQNGEPAEAGIEHADGRRSGRGKGTQGLGTSPGTAVATSPVR